VTSGDFHNTGPCNEDDAKCGPDYDFGASAILVRLGGRDLLLAGKSPASSMHSIPTPKAKSCGKSGWAQVASRRRSMGMASDEQNVYAAVSDIVALPDQSDTGGAPVGGANFDPVKGGGLTALRLTDGAKMWFAPSYPCLPPRPGCSPAQSAAITAIPGAVFSGALDGHVRAFSTADGLLLWILTRQGNMPRSTESQLKAGRGWRRPSSR